MDQKLSDLRSDLLQSIDSLYAEFSHPKKDQVIESIKGVFLSSDSYEYPELKEQILKSVRFLFSDGDTPNKYMVKDNLKAVFLSWRYNEK